MQVFKILTVAECNDLAIANVAAFNNYVARLYVAYVDGFIDACTFINAKLDAYNSQKV